MFFEGDPKVGWWWGGGAIAQGSMSMPDLPRIGLIITCSNNWSELVPFPGRSFATDDRQVKLAGSLY